MEAEAAAALAGLTIRASLYRCNEEGEVDTAGGSPVPGVHAAVPSGRSP